MKKFNAAEWQSFATRKDIESITRKINSLSSFQSSIFIEIALVVLGVALENIFVAECEQRFFWNIILLVCVGLIIFQAVQWIILKLRSIAPGSDRMKAKEFIDRFDNQICYYVLMSESYYAMLVETDQDSSIDSDIKRFYFIEASYYMNKAICELRPVYNIAESVLSNAKDDVVGKRMIAFARYTNMCNLLKTINNYLDKHKGILQNLEGSDTIIKANEHYASVLDNITHLVSKLDIHPSTYISP